MPRSNATSYFLCVCLGVTLVGSGLLPAAAADEFGSWPQWRGPERKGLSSDTGLIKDWDAKPPKLLWEASGLGSGYASISLVDGKIYTVGDINDEQFVLCLSAADGKVLWSKAISKKSTHSYPGSRCTPSIDGDRLYVVGSNGDIVCLKTADGEIVWSKNFEKEWDGKMMSIWGFAESPLVDGDKVLCTPGGSNAMVVALNKQNGEVLWKCPAPVNAGSQGKDGAGYSSIVISNAGGVKQYVQLIGRGLIGIDAETGRLLWSYNGIANKTANIPTPIVSGDFIFASTGYQTGAALIELKKEGSEIVPHEIYFLEKEVFQNHHGGMVLVDGHIYAGNGHNKGFPICIEMSTGKVAWQNDGRDLGTGSAALTYADGMLYYRFQSGDMALVEATPAGFNLHGKFKIPNVQNPSWPHPVVVGGRLYLREQDKLYCYGVKE